MEKVSATWHATRLAVRLAVTAWMMAALWLSASARKGNDTFEKLADQAQKANEENRLDDAVHLYARALTLRPRWAEGWWSLATLEYDRDHYAKAAADFQKVIALQPGNGTAHAMLGLSEFELGHASLALQHIEKGKRLGLQKNLDLWHVVLYHEGILMQRKGSFQAAQDTLEELCLQTGSNDRAATVLGMTMLRLSATEPPRPGSADADVVLRVGRAECLAGQKKYDESRPALEEAVKEYPNYPNIHYAFGLFLLELRDVAAAVDQFKQEIVNQPNDVVARLRIAATEYKQDSAAGLPYAEEAVKLAPQQPYGHYLLGLLRLDVDDYLKAIPELEIAEKGLPREPKIYFALGTAYSRAGRKKESAEARATFVRLTEEAKKRAVETTPGPRTSGPDNIPVGDVPPPPQ